MSELRWNWVYYPYLDAPNKQEESALKAGYIKVVIKDEADKVIAELEDNLQAANEQIENLINSASSIMLFQDRVNDNTYAELRHQKYKRCLAMARMCEERSARYDVLQERHDLDWGREIEFYYRWYKRWLEIAEKFKEAK